MKQNKIKNLHCTIVTKDFALRKEQQNSLDLLSQLIIKQSEPFGK